MIKKCRFVSLAALLVLSFSTLNGFSQTKKTVAKKPVAELNTPKKIVAPVAKADGSLRIKISTDSGIIIVRLSDSTPLHRDNFAKLVKEGFYDSLLFHRVIPQFMIQGGDPTSKYAQPGMMLGNGGDNLSRIPAEFKPSLYHKKGVLAAARDGNPEKASSACQFYLVEGKLWTDEQLNMMEQQEGVKYTPEQRINYKTIGGTPHLDGAYTVFGEVETGIEVIGKIANVSRDTNNRPLGDIRMKMEILQ
jgi:peptidyl-prolyl cis-trans isomerase B (cyclophilin B)